MSKSNTQEKKGGNKKPTQRKQPLYKKGRSKSTKLLYQYVCIYWRKYSCVIVNTMIFTIV